MADELPPSFQADDPDELPPSFRTTVREHTRAPKKKGLGQRAADLLPAAGGFAGGIIGGTAGAAAGGVGAIPGGIAGAAAGGAGGEAYRQIAYQAMGLPAPTSSLEAATSIGKEGAIQGAFEAGGGVVMKGARFVAKPLMQWAMKASPEVAKVAIREGITSTQQGVNKILRKIGESAGETRRIAAAAPGQFQASDIALEVHRRMLPVLERLPVKGAAITKIQQLTKGFLDGSTGLVKPTALLKLKQGADDIAEPIYRKIARREPVEATDLITAQWHKQFADYSRELLETIPGIAQQNARTAELIAVKKAVAPVVRRNTGLGAQIAGRGAGVAIGGSVGAMSGTTTEERAWRGAEGALIGAAATSPAVLSWLAIHAPQLFGQAVTQGSRAGVAATRQY